MSVTIRDVAKRADVSIKTVSRVINNEPFVRDTTREKVYQAIEELGFVANLSARRLATGQSFTLGLIFHNASWYYIKDVQKGVLETAREFGYSTIMHPCDVNNESDRQEVIRLVTQRITDGLIFTPPADNSKELLEDLDRLKVPFVRLTPSDQERPWPYVTVTDRQGSYAMTQYLLKLGHTRIAYIVGPLEQKAAHDRFDGYKAALQKAGIDIDSSIIEYGNDHFESGLAATQKLLDANPRPTAVFCNNDEMAAGAIAKVNEAGLRVPGDVSIAGFDDIDLARQIWPPMTTVRQPIYEIAKLATNTLVKMLNDEELIDLYHEIPTELVMRKSTAPVNSTG